jgi:hypothetical protein
VLVQHLESSCIARRSFTSPRQVREAIDRLIVAYNESATPFEWRKRNVQNVHPHKSYADLHN